MKKLALALLLSLSAGLLFGQRSKAAQSKYISVTGSAEVVVAPDEIELEIVLMEYTVKNDVKVELSAIESNFAEILKKHNVEIDDMIFGDYNFYWYYWWAYRGAKYKQKRFMVELDSSTDLLSLVKDLDTEGVHSLRISNTTNSKLQELRKEIKISAVKAAKEKAVYLLESIDEQVGSVISIDEVPDEYNYYWRGNQNIMSNAVISSNASGADVANVHTIKLRYAVAAKFEIK